MVEPEKPFACTMPDCLMTFTNEDHLHVHTKNHDMMLQIGSEQKTAFVADQTPTPTRFIKNCEEVGLFQDLQNVNPFDEDFKRAMETKQGMLTLEHGLSPTDDLHTPQMMYPLMQAGDSTLYSTTNNQRNITISRSSSDESGAIKEFETTTISKLTNEVTTISRIVEKHDDAPKNEETRKDIRTDSVSYTNNVIKIHSNVEIRKDIEKNPLHICEDMSQCKQVQEVPAIMSQKSIDLVVDSFTSDLCQKEEQKRTEDYEVFIKLPNGRQVRMKSVEETDRNTPSNTKDKLKKVLTSKAEKSAIQRVNSEQNSKMISSIVSLPTGTLIPVTIINQSQIVPKIPIQPLIPTESHKLVKRRSDKGVSGSKNNARSASVSGGSEDNSKRVKNNGLDRRHDMDSKCAASRRYRARLKQTYKQQALEIQQLKEKNERLTAEKAMLKLLITEHMKTCPNADDFRNLIDRLKETGSNL